MTPPVESHFDSPECSHGTGYGDYIEPTELNTEENTETEFFSTLNGHLNNNIPVLLSNEENFEHDSFDNCENTSSTEENCSLSEEERSRMRNHSKATEELSRHIQCMSQYERFKPHTALFANSSLTLLNSMCFSDQESTALDNVLSNFHMARIQVPPDGNCLFQSVSHAVSTILSDKSVSSDVLQHLEGLGLTDCKDVSGMCSKLRELVVCEWLSNSDMYRAFLTNEQPLDTEAYAFFTDGHFASELGNSMPLAMANVLKLPIVVISKMENIPVIPVTPRETLQCIPLYIAFDHSGPGHYDAVEVLQPTATAHSDSKETSAEES